MFVMLCALLAPVEPTITYANGSLPLGKALAEVSAQAGVKMTAGDVYFNRPVFLLLDKVPVSTFKAQLAEAAVGTWQRDGDTLTLLPDRPKQRAQAQARLEADVKSLRTAIQKLRETAQLDRGFDAALAQRLAAQVPAASYRRTGDGGWSMDRQTMLRREALSAQTPLGRALAEIVLKVDPREWAQLPTPSRVVYSTQPTRMQRRLPAMDQVMTRFAAEQKTWLAAISSVEDPFQEWRPQGNQSADPPAFAMLAAQRFDSTRIDLNLQVFTAKGAAVGRVNRTLAVDPVFLDSLNSIGEIKVTTPATPVALSPLASEFASLLRTNMRMGKSMPPSKELKAALLQPERADPLGLTAFESVTALARHEGRNVIAFPGDFTFAFGSMPVPGASGQQLDRHPTLAEIERMMRVFFRRTDRDGFWILTDSSPFGGAEPMPRPLLGQFLRGVDRVGRLDLNLRIQLAMLSTDERISQVPLLFAQIINGSQSRFDSFTAWDALRLLGSLTPAQNQAARTAEGIPLGGLSAEQRADIGRIVFSQPYVSLNLTAKPNRRPEDYNLFYSGAMREATFALGEGILPTGRLYVEVREEMTGQLEPFERERGFGMTSISSPEEMAMMQHSIESNDAGYAWTRPKDPAAAQKLLDNIQMGRRTTISMRIQFNDEVQWGESIADFEVMRKGVKMAEMPEAFRKRFDQHLKMLRSSQIRTASPVGRGAAGTAPPP